MQMDISTIVFALVAVFVAWKLRSVLGSRGPTQPPIERRPPGAMKSPPLGEVIQLKAASPAAPTETPPLDRWKGFAAPGSPIAAGFDAIAAVDASFAPDSFLSGARTAYEMIVGAFAAGDLSTLRRLLAPEVLANFEKAIRARVAAEQTMTTTLVSIDSASVVEARLAGTAASVAVRFAAKLVSVTHDKAGAAVDGSPNDVVDHLDVWTFTRDIAAGDPNWLLTATQTVN
jgi:predicted lipid-binding transport protein (Tim44 family)